MLLKVHLDPSGQINLCAHEFFAVSTGHGRDLFQHGTLFADDNTLMAGLFTVDRGIDIDDTVVPFCKGGDLHCGSVGDFLIQIPQQLFADDLGHDLLFGLVGGHIVREQEGAF